MRYPDPVLGAATQSVEGKLSPEVIQETFRLMYKHRGIGLAAPQVGLSLRFFVANLEPEKRDKRDELVCVNPRIIRREGVETDEEACLSLPGLHGRITRAAKVVVEFTDLHGKKIVREADGLAARMFQHEIDHLDGLLILDRMSPAERRAQAEALKSLERAYEERKRME